MDPTSIIQHALRASAVLAVALFAVIILRRSRASLRHAILASALAATVLLPLVSFAAPRWHLSTATPVTVPAGAPVAEPLDTTPRAAVRVSPIARPPLVASAHRMAGSLPWVVAAWAIGALAVASRLVAGVVQARRLVRRSKPVHDAAFRTAVAVVQAEVGVRARVRASDTIDAPAVTGVFAPVILVPRAASTWSDERLRAVLVHELAHVRQLDCLAQLMSHLACAMHWYNPLAWLTLRRLRIERELAADDAVLDTGRRPSSYAEDLVALATAAPRRHFATAALDMARPSDLRLRIAAILSPLRPMAPATRGRRTAAIGFSVATALVIGCVDASAPPSDEKSAVSAAEPVSPSTTAYDPSLQTIAEDEITQLIGQWHPTAATILVLDPWTGEVLANAGRLHGAEADVAMTRALAPGSTLKVLTIAAALEERAIDANARFDCGAGHRKYGTQILRDAGENGVLGVGEILSVSSNIGVSRIFDALGGKRLQDWLHKLHFGEAPAVDMEGVASGWLPASIDDDSFEGAVVASGQGLTASAVQVATLYATVANGGTYWPPRLGHGGSAHPGERVMRAETARTLLTMLQQAVEAERATGRAARVDGVHIGGKTGTAGLSTRGETEATYASFVGIVDTERPRFVILVGVESPEGAAPGGTVAAPAFARVAARALQR
jgi:beta-lactamase regulating signal transducer with metallopeptidase domain